MKTRELMNLAIIGYGKMGRLVEQLAPEYGCGSVAAGHGDNAECEGMTTENFRGIDVAVEFSAPAAAAENIERLACDWREHRGGHDGMVERNATRARAAVERSGTGLVWSPNFSIGVNVFMQMVAEAARLLAPHPEYGAWAWEIHHATKKDAPSGTLLKMVEEMKKADTKAHCTSSSRAGAHPGTHEIGFDSAADTITIRHTARSREGFARGALRAARWVVGQKGLFRVSRIVCELE